VASIRRRAIASALHNFLGTLSSRYSDYDGYWIFGLLISDLSCSTVDLLVDEPTTIGPEAWRAFVTIARCRFAEQLQLNSVARFVRRAALDVKRGRLLSGTVNGHISNGYDVTLSVEAVSDLARVYRDHASLFVAAHDPSLESRSLRRKMDSLTRHGAGRARSNSST